MGRHRASNGRTHSDDSNLVRNFQHAFQPTILDKAVRLRTGIYIDVGAKTPPIEVRVRPQTAHEIQRPGGDYMQNFLVEKIAVWWICLTTHDRLKFGGRETLGADAFE